MTIKTEGIALPKSPEPMLPNSGKGKELCDLLRRELSIPAGVKSFTVRFAMSEPVVVTAEYRPGDIDAP